MLCKRHGDAAFATWQAKREATRATAATYDQQALRGQFDILYNFGHDLIDDQQLRFSAEGIQVPGFAQPLLYRRDERYSDML